MNGATCFDTAAAEEGFTCRCAEGFYGNQCENHVMTEAVQPSVVVVTETQTQTQTETQIQTQTQNQTLTETETEIQTQNQTQTQTETETQYLNYTETQTQTETDTQNQTVTETKTQTQTQTEASAVLFCPSSTADDMQSSSSSDLEPSCPTTRTIEPDVNYCAGDPCGRNGVCYNTTTGAVCKCNAGWTGENCSQGKSSFLAYVS